MVKDSHWACKTGLSDALKDFSVAITFSDGQDFLTESFTVVERTVEVDRQEMRQDFREDLLESVDLMVSVVKVVHDTDVWHVDGFEQTNLVFRLAVPSAVVVEGDFATRLVCSDSDFADAIYFGLDKGLGLFFVHVWIAATGDPELWMDLVFFDQGQN